MKKSLLALLGLFSLLLCWQLSSLWLAHTQPLAKMLAPYPTFEHLFYLLKENQLQPHIFASLKRVIVALLLAMSIGIPIGIALGVSTRLSQFTSASFQLIRMTSPLSLMPIAMMTFGIGNPPIYALLCLSAIWPLVLSTSKGVRHINRQWLELGASLSATPLEILTRIILPAILGDMLNGIRLAIAMVWTVLVPCEMLGVSEGLGYYILDTRDRLAYSELTAAIVVIGAIGWTLDAIARTISQQFLQPATH